MTIITTNRTLSFVTLSDGSLHTFEESPRSVVPQGFIPAGTPIELTGKAKFEKMPNTNVGTVELEGNLVTVRIHDNHLLTKEQAKGLRKQAPVAGKVQETAMQKMARLGKEMEEVRVAAKVEEQAALKQARALIEANGGVVEMPSDEELDQELAAVNS